MLNNKLCENKTAAIMEKILHSGTRYFTQDSKSKCIFDYSIMDKNLLFYKNTAKLANIKLYASSDKAKSNLYFKSEKLAFI